MMRTLWYVGRPHDRPGAGAPVLGWAAGPAGRAGGGGPSGDRDRDRQRQAGIQSLSRPGRYAGTTRTP
jgi:hypothetical protein